MEEQKQNDIQPVAKGHITEKKKTVGRKILDLIGVAEDEDIRGYVIRNLVKPTVLNGLADILDGLAYILVDSIDYVLRGRVGGRTRRYDGSRGSGRDYGAYSDRRGSERMQEAPRRVHTAYGGTEDVWFEDRSQAIDLRDRLCDILERNGSVSVYEWFENADLRAPNGSNDWNYGWYDLRDMSVENDHGKWYVLMPKVVQLKKGDGR